MDLFIVIYCLACAILGIYGFNCHFMTALYRKRHEEHAQKNAKLMAEFYGPSGPGLEGPGAARLPLVTTQVPIYNEFNVAERVLDAVAAMRYPAGKHEIQVLDDSTDETRDVVARKVAELAAQGVDIKQITRTDRVGYKAGALRQGMAKAKGEFVAIFDADFVPPPDFLLYTVPQFLDDPKVGIVQARWDHLNREESLLTRLVSLGIDGHFKVEQTARASNGLFMNFNGTAGMFRKSAIAQAGGWQDDTLTEDLDLSYRLQLAGYTCRYVPEMPVPAEIPADINAFKSQQFRWAKGSIQTAKKLLPRILRSPATPRQKFCASVHLTHYLVGPLMAFLAAAALPILLVRGARPGDSAYLMMGLFLLVTTSGPSVMYLTAQKGLGRNPMRALPLMPLMVVLGCGLAINNTRAVFEALWGKPSAFVRTPKNGDAGSSGAAKAYRVALDPVFFAEALAGMWCAAAVAFYWSTSHYLVGHFMLVYSLGFLTMATLSWRHGRARA
jgi:cellulose synthase/poly-beta-1,6-N-acetylglucosamine synthase-like glycosyltransferase